MVVGGGTLLVPMWLRGLVQLLMATFVRIISNSGLEVSVGACSWPTRVPAMRKRTRSASWSIRRNHCRCVHHEKTFVFKSFTCRKTIHCGPPSCGPLLGSPETIHRSQHVRFQWNRSTGFQRVRCGHVSSFPCPPKLSHRHPQFLHFSIRGSASSMAVSAATTSSGCRNLTILSLTRPLRVSPTILAFVARCRLPRMRLVPATHPSVALSLSRHRLSAHTT